jgi:hypothetical protein
MRLRPLSSSRLVLASLSVGLLFVAACGGDSGSSSKVASLGTDNATGGTTAVTAAANTQEQWLAFAQCMRDNGVDMKDPTFDANGNLQGGFGPGSGVDFRSAEARTAITACRDKLPAGGPGGAGGPQFDRTAIQAALNNFTSCLRDQGLEVDDVSFGAGPGGGQGGTPPTGDVAPPGTGDGGGFQGGPPPGGAGGAGGAGFDPTARIIDRLGLDTTDPAVTAAVAACKSNLDGAFPGGNGATGSTTTLPGS